MSTTYIVRAFWDEESKMWVATSHNFIGVATEAETLEKLIQKLDVIVPEILEANGYITNAWKEVPYALINERIASGHDCH